MANYFGEKGWLKLYWIKKIIYIFIGSVSLVLGSIGAFFPVLPTTPFLLLAAFCYMRSSRRMYQWLIHNKMFGAYVYSYVTYRAIPKKTKIRAITILWATLILSIIYVPLFYVKALLLVIGTAATVYLTRLDTLDNEEAKALADFYDKN